MMGINLDFSLFHMIDLSISLCARRDTPFLS
jgi:hypothetical protein